MRYCLPCGAEYNDEVLRCADCGCRTVSEAERRTWQDMRDALTHEHFVPLHVLEGPVDQAFLTELFDDAGIPWVLHGHQHDALGSIFRPQAGWGVLMVPEEDVDRARDVVEQYKRSVVVESSEE